MFNDVNFRVVLDHVSDGVYVLDPQRKILHWNRSAERLTGYPAAEVVGRSCRDNILVHVNDKGECLCDGRCPVVATLEDGLPHQAEVFLHHKDGYRVPVRVDVSPVRDEAGKVVGAVETFQENAVLIAMRTSIEKLKQWTVVDLETGLTSRRSTEMRFQTCIEELKRYQRPFGILLAEIDYYSTLQRALSPEMLCRVRRMVGRSVLHSLRSMDTVGRWSDHQFLAIVANADVDDMQAAANRARAIVHASFIKTDEGEVRATVSIGATAATESDTVDAMLRRTERSLLVSRSAGKNCVTVHGSTNAG